MDAVRIEDGRQVMLKKVLLEEGPHEWLITQLLRHRGSRETLRIIAFHCSMSSICPTSDLMEGS